MNFIVYYVKSIILYTLLVHRIIYYDGLMVYNSYYRHRGVVFQAHERSFENFILPRLFIVCGALSCRNTAALARMLSKLSSIIFSSCGSWYIHNRMDF